MTAFTPKTYQQQVLDSIEAYFKACHELPSPSIAFTATTERLWGRGNAYNPLSGFLADMPYFCLRVPTGGGKTWLAAKSVTIRHIRYKPVRIPAQTPRWHADRIPVPGHPCNAP